ncbi:hypothetical protein [Phocaeicola abscessus]|nr:hypothetical protein [Phocaeicola abscessus]EPT32956.1 hypothetical protein HMPREF9012_1888 [Bacteroidetes bacterium oral taxon 272 str. F0290]
MGKNHRKTAKEKRARDKANKIIKGICIALIVLAILLMFVFTYRI